jgi:hypothetical protein
MVGRWPKEIASGIVRVRPTRRRIEPKEKRVGAAREAEENHTYEIAFHVLSLTVKQSQGPPVYCRKYVVNDLLIVLRQMNVERDTHWKQYSFSFQRSPTAFNWIFQITGGFNLAYWRGNSEIFRLDLWARKATNPISIHEIFDYSHVL